MRPRLSVSVLSTIRVLHVCAGVGVLSDVSVAFFLIFYAALRSLDKDDVLHTHNSLIQIQELLLTHSPSSFKTSHYDDSDVVSAPKTSVRGSDATLIASLEQLLNSHSNVVHDVLAAGDPALYKPLFTSAKDP